ncbi:MAG: hypothetical protein KAI29_12300 [Cyclobacteriaceae bacterium]|nr:hypothetical protein [Cyclobacteriaceae bacterium]
MTYKIILSIDLLHLIVSYTKGSALDTIPQKEIKLNAEIGHYRQILFRIDILSIMNSV